MGIYKKLINAVFYCDADKAMSLMQKNAYSKQWLNDIGVFDTPLPLYYIALCAQAILSDAEDPWSADFELIRQKMLNGCKRILAFMKSEYDFDVDSEIDYEKYTEYFYAADKDETDEDILWAPVQRILDEGKSQLDIDLYCAVERFQYDLVDQLLQAGANPRTLIEDGFALDRIGTECSFLDTQICPLWKAYYHSSRTTSIDEGAISDLLGWAAHEKMYNLLVKI